MTLRLKRTASRLALNALPVKTGTVPAVWRGSWMVRRHGPGKPRGNQVPMRRQGQEQSLAALEIHPLESLRIAGLAGLQRDVAGLSRPSDRDVLPTLRLECDAATAAVHNTEYGGLLPAAGAYRADSLHRGEGVPVASRSAWIAKPETAQSTRGAAVIR